MSARPERAVIFQRPRRASWDRQVQACVRYAEKQGYRITAVVGIALDAVTLVTAGLADVVMSAIDAPDDGELSGQLEALGSRLEYCRPRRFRQELARQARNADEIAARMYDLGASLEEIGRLLGIPAQRLREVVLRRSQA